VKIFIKLKNNQLTILLNIFLKVFVVEMSYQSDNFNPNNGRDPTRNPELAYNYLQEATGETIVSYGRDIPYGTSQQELVNYLPEDSPTIIIWNPVTMMFQLAINYGTRYGGWFFAPTWYRFTDIYSRYRDQMMFRSHINSLYGSYVRDRNNLGEDWRRRFNRTHGNVQSTSRGMSGVSPTSMRRDSESRRAGVSPTSMRRDSVSPTSMRRDSESKRYSENGRGAVSPMRRDSESRRDSEMKRNAVSPMRRDSTRMSNMDSGVSSAAMRRDSTRMSNMDSGVSSAAMRRDSRMSGMSSHRMSTNSDLMGNRDSSSIRDRRMSTMSPSRMTEEGEMESGRTSMRGSQMMGRDSMDRASSSRRTRQLSSSPSGSMPTPPTYFEGRSRLPSRSSSSAVRSPTYTESRYPSRIESGRSSVTLR
jgi:hypothetical protein